MCSNLQIYDDVAIPLFDEPFQKMSLLRLGESKRSETVMCCE